MLQQKFRFYAQIKKSLHEMKKTHIIRQELKAHLLEEWINILLKICFWYKWNIAQWLQLLSTNILQTNNNHNHLLNHHQQQQQKKTNLCYYIQ